MVLLFDARGKNSRVGCRVANLVTRLPDLVTWEGLLVTKKSDLVTSNLSGNLEKLDLVTWVTYSDFLVTLVTFSTNLKN